MNEDIKKVYEKLKKIFKDIGKTKLELNDDLLKNIAFMSVTLQKLQDEINDKGVTEHFEQGKQNFIRENPALKSYNATFKNYTAAIKQLNDLIPEDSKKQDGEKLLKFIAGDSK